MSDKRSVESLVRHAQLYRYPAVSLVAEGLLILDRRLAAVEGQRPVPVLPDAEKILHPLRTNRRLSRGCNATFLDEFKSDKLVEAVNAALQDAYAAGYRAGLADSPPPA